MFTFSRHNRIGRLSSLERFAKLTTTITDAALDEYIRYSRSQKEMEGGGLNPRVITERSRQTYRAAIQGIRANFCQFMVQHCPRTFQVKSGDSTTAWDAIEKGSLDPTQTAKENSKTPIPCLHACKTCVRRTRKRLQEAGIETEDL
jgi:hypothetical protein